MWRKCTKCSFPPLYLLTFVPKLHRAAILAIVRDFNRGGIILSVEFMGVDDVAAAPVDHEEPIACHTATLPATDLAFGPGGRGGYLPPGSCANKGLGVVRRLRTYSNLQQQQ